MALRTFWVFLPMYLKNWVMVIRSAATCTRSPGRMMVSPLGIKVS